MNFEKDVRWSRWVFGYWRIDMWPREVTRHAFYFGPFAFKFDTTKK